MWSAVISTPNRRLMCFWSCFGLASQPSRAMACRTASILVSFFSGLAAPPLLVVVGAAGVLVFAMSASRRGGVGDADHKHTPYRPNVTVRVTAGLASPDAATV